MRLDHLVVGCRDLDAGERWLEAQLGAPAGGGGEHIDYGTHNRLWRLDGDRYLELIAVNPAATGSRKALFGLSEKAVQARLEQRPRLLSWVARVEQGADESHALRCAPGLAPPVAVRRGRFSWRLAVAVDGGLVAGGAVPYLIWWQAPHPTEALPDVGLSLESLGLPASADPETDDILAELSDRVVCTIPGNTGLVAELATPRGPVTLS